MHFSLKAILVALVPLALAVPCADAQIQSAQFVAYPCQYKSVDEIAALLRPLLPKSPAVQLVIDRDQNRILLSGSNDLQAVALRLIRTVDRPPKRPQASTPQPPTTRPLLQPAPQAQLQPTANQGRTGRLVFVSPDRFVRLHQQLDAVFGLPSATTCWHNSKASTRISGNSQDLDDEYSIFLRILGIF